MRVPLRALLPLGVALALSVAWVGFRIVTAQPGQAAPPGTDVQVIDGDTIQLDGRIVHLFGIDAPELGQRCLADDIWSHCGLTAAFELGKLIGVGQAPVDCSPSPGRQTPAGEICLVGRTDLAHALLTGGYVVATVAANPDYREAEAEAIKAGLGIWHSKFVPPADWRAGRRLPDKPEIDNEPCPIKAVIDADGRRLYYVPTDQTYQSVTIDAGRGDRLFCSVQEASAAGWRHDGETETASH